MPVILKSGSLSLLETPGPVQACNGIALPLLKVILLYIYIYYISQTQSAYERFSSAIISEIPNAFLFEMFLVFKTFRA